jgi:hypothetical protein
MNAMSMPLSGTRVPGKRLFVAGCITLVLFSTVHLIPMFIFMLSEPTAPVEIEAKRAMGAVAVDMGPFHTSWLGLNQLLSASYSALLYFVATVNLVVLPSMIAQGRLRALACVNAIFAGVLLAIAVLYQFPPPAVFSLVAGAFFLGAMMKATPPEPAEGFAG